MEFIATCPQGFEPLLAEELHRLHAQAVRPLTGQVSFTGALDAGYAACLHSRLASRVILVLARFDAADQDTLYQGAVELPWEEHLPLGQACAVDAHGTNQALKSETFTAQRVMDAIRDRMLARKGVRVRAASDAAFVVSVRLHGEKATAGIVLSGADPLFKRRLEKRAGGLRADYAAAMVALAGEAGSFWLPARASETLKAELEDALCRRAPGLSRLRWGFENWLAHDEALWEELVREARAQERDKGYSLTKASEAEALLFDLSWLHADELAREAAALAQLSASAASAQPDARMVTFAREGLLAGCAPASKRIATRVGRSAAAIELRPAASLVQHSTIQLADGAAQVLVKASDQFAARLAKNARARAKQARKQDVSCYRVYDADLPDYAVAIDFFEGEGRNARWLSISEYAAPKSIDAGLARRRLMDVLALAPRILEVDPNHVSLRVRTRERGGSQYAGMGEGNTAKRTLIFDEGGLLFEADFSNRLDCGIFLDHRDTRAMLREMMKQAAEPKRFLNLFAYTGTASVYAADGGARTTTTVDLSRPSLEIARRNMERNGFTGSAHSFVQADVLAWVAEKRHSRERFELIFCDVPTFSNSARMRKRSFDVQRDHAELLIGVSRLLSPGGVCVFSCNLKGFKPDVGALAKAGVAIEDITAQTIPFDYERTPRVHSAYLVRRTAAPRA